MAVPCRECLRDFLLPVRRTEVFKLLSQLQQCSGPVHTGPIAQVQIGRGAATGMFLCTAVQSLFLLSTQAMMDTGDNVRWGFVLFSADSLSVLF